MDDLGRIVFDMDGTLVNAMPQHAEIFGRILQTEFGIPIELSKEEYLNTAGRPLHEQFDLVVNAEEGHHLDDASYLLDRFWLGISNLEPILFPNTHETVNKLYHAGYKLFVISGCAPFVVESKMKRSNLNGFFSLMLGTDRNINDMVKGSGHLRVIRKSLALSEEDFVETTLIVGDGEHDISLAKSAGLLSIGIAGTANKETLRKAGASFVINDISEILNILGSESEYKPISRLRGRGDV